MINETIQPVITEGVAPGYATAPFLAECGFNTCVPHQYCADAIAAAGKLHYIIQIGFIVMAVCLILICEYYRRKAKKLETQLKEKEVKENVVE